jgi:diguanylate cyclase (GGDEF)-like protein
MTVQQPSANHLSEGKPQQALRRLAGSIAFIQIAVLLLLVAVILVANVVMNRSAFNAQNELIDNALDKYVTQTINEQKSVAFWDESSRLLSSAKLNNKWADVEIGAYLSENYGHDEIYVISGSGESIYSYVDSQRRESNIFLKRSQIINPLIGEIRQTSKRSHRHRETDFQNQMQRYIDLSGAKSGRAAANILSIDGSLSIVSAITVVPTINMTLAKENPPILVSIVKIDQNIINKIGASLLIKDLRLLPVRNGKPQYAIKPLYSDDGMMAAELVWTVPTPGRLMLTTVLPLVFIAALIAGFMLRSLLRRLIQSAHDLSTREASARYESLHDSLSGLPNRRSFLLSLQEGLHQSAADGLQNSVAYIDIDHFKDINDTLGHSLGDSLILKVGERLKAALGPDDHVARLGGDEFAVLRRSSGDIAALRLGQDIHAALTGHYDLDGSLTKVTVSVGLAASSGYDTSAEIVLRHADIALYDAKDLGRNRISHFAESMAAALEDRTSLEADLREAIITDNIYMVYQPIIDAQSHQIAGVEALVRWRHPLRGVVPPADFIPIAERCGLMPLLGEEIFKRVFRDAQRWPSLEVSVNLSPAQIRDDNLLPMVQRLQTENAIKPGQIVFEITEGVMLEATEQAHKTLGALTARGFKIALDDFGTGYSSLSYLRQFKFDKIKIDRSFVQDAAHKQQSMWIVQAIVALGTGLGMRVVAEGVETENEADMMINAGCNELQGYYFSRPIDAQVIDAFFEDHEAMADKKIMPL